MTYSIADFRRDMREGANVARISFKAKCEQVYNADGTPAFVQIKVPTLTRSHCDMAAFRSHPKFGGLANSDLFPGVLSKLRRERVLHTQYGDHIRLDKLREGVTVDTSGFLATVTIEV